MSPSTGKTTFSFICRGYKWEIKDSNLLFMRAITFYIYKTTCWVKLLSGLIKLKLGHLVLLQDSHCFPLFILLIMV